MHANHAFLAESKALEGLAASLTDLARAALASLPTEETADKTEKSMVARLHTAAAATQGGDHVLQAARLAERSFLSACDHTIALGSLLRAESRPSTALFTVARGALEAAARTWWLIEDVEIDAYLPRILSMLHTDLQHPARAGAVFPASSEGKPIEAAKLREYYGEELARLGSPKAVNISLSTMVQQLLDQTASHIEQERLYSVYSGIAHSQLASLNALTTPSSTGQPPTLNAPLPTITALTAEVLLAIKFVGDRLITWLGGPNAERPVLLDACNRVAETLRTLPKVALAPEA